MKIRNVRPKWALSAILLPTIVIVLFAHLTMWAQLLKPGEIIYSRAATVAGGNCDTASIWAVGQDGSNDRFITNGLHPRISPDGRLILFKRFDPSAACGPFFNGGPQWWIRDLTTKQETHISNNFFVNFGHAFSPETNRADGQIMFDDQTAVCRMNLDGTNRSCNFFAPRMWGHMSVRGRDSMVAMGFYDSNFQALSGISTFTYDFANLQKIPNTSFGDLDPSWSNDGQTIAYAFFPGGRQEPYFFTNLFKINPDGSNKTQLTFLNPPQAEGFSYSLVWTLDNSTILNAAKINGVAGIYKISATGGGILGTIPITPGAAPEWVGGIAPAYSEQQVASFGGGVTNGGNYTLVDTVGQAFAGQTSKGGTYNLQSGFWTNAAPVRSRSDFDGDGKTDVTVYGTDGNWFSQKSGGGVLVQQWGQPGDVPVPGDYDGDGKADVAVYRPSNGVWFIVRSSNSTVQTTEWGGGTSVPVAADYDGDGKTDVAVYQSGLWYIVGSTSGVRVAEWGEGNSIPEPGDYDGDGKADVAVYEPDNGLWFIFGSTAGTQVYQWGGTSGDVAVPGDYDGDGKTDVAVYRSGLWYVLNSTGGFHVTEWGEPTDIPVPGDYDGDGHDDIAIYRSGLWYIMGSTNGFRLVEWGSPTDIPIPPRSAP